MRERLLAELDARIARHVAGDSSGVLDVQALALVSELAASGAPDAGSLTRVAALHLCRFEAGRGAGDRDLALAVYTKLHAVDPRLVPSAVRVLLGLASPHDRAVALVREYERTGRLDVLDRAISLFRQEVLENGAAGRHDLGLALRLRYDHTGHPADRAESDDLTG